MTDYSAHSDEALVALCKEQNQAAWDALVRRYFADASYLSSRLCNSSVETEDLFSEGLFGFCSAVLTYSAECGSSFRTYANACMRHRMLNVTRGAQTQKQIPLVQCVPFDELIQAADSRMLPEERIIAKTEAQKLEQIISNALTENERKVFWLFTLGGSYGEISRKTGLSVKAVDGTLQRARKKLRAQLA